MAWSNSKAVGQWNSRLIVEVVLNSQSGNSSNITVRIRLKNGGNSTALNNNGVSWSMSNGVSASGSDTFSIGAGSTGTLASRTFNVSHNADGNKTISVTVNVGATGTSTFGTPGSLTVSGIKLPRIARAPSKPAKPTISNIGSSSFRANLASAPANNGAGIIEYRWEIENLTNPSTATQITSGRTWNTDGRGPNTQYRVRVQARNSVGWGPYSAWSATITTKPLAPAAPSGGKITFVDDRTLRVAWANHPSGTAPYESLILESWNTIEDTWRRAATLGGTATSYTDTDRSLNRQYQYRIIAENSAGRSNVAWAGRIYTQPNAPSTPTATKLPGGDIAVSWSNRASYPISRYEVWDSPNGGAWVKVGETTGTSFTHTSPNAAQTHMYRVRAVRLADETNTQPTLYSNYSGNSVTVQLIAPPNAPTLDAPSGTLNRALDIVFRWTHRPVDTTAQTAYELRYRVNGGAWTTLTGTTAQSRTVAALGVSGTVEWQVRTKGEHATFSPWAPVSSFTLASQPTVAINTPEGPTLEVSTVELTWGYNNDDASGQTQWQAELRDSDDGLVEQRSGTGAGASTVFRTALVDGETYTARVRVRSGAGIWSDWTSVTFSTDFPMPARAVVFPEWDRETGSVMLTFEVLDPVGDETEAEYVDVQRNDGDGWITIATEIDPETSIIDYTPRLGEVYYRAISRTSLPSAQIGDETVIEWEHGRDPIFVNAGTGFGDVARLIGDQITDSPAIEQSSQEWAGWEWPTAVFGEGSSNTIQFTGQIIHTVDHDSSSVDEWKDLLSQRGVVCFRDCQGRKIFGLLGLGFSRNGPVTAVTITVDQVHHIEGVTDVPELVEAGA